MIYDIPISNIKIKYMMKYCFSAGLCVTLVSDTQLHSEEKGLQLK